MKRAQDDFNKGEYQWVAGITMAVVLADPSNTDARYLCTDASEQLGYKTESGVWCAAYLAGAQELREGLPSSGIAASRGGDMLRAREPYMLFDYLGIRKCLQYY